MSIDDEEASYYGGLDDGREESMERIASLESQVSRMRAVVDAARELDSHVTRFWFQPPGKWWSGLHDTLSSIDTGEE